MNKSTIRQATADDIDAVMDCSKSAYKKFTARIGYEPLPMVTDYAEPIANLQVWVLAENEAVSGVLVLHPEPDHLLVYSVAIRSEFQGMGYGRKLMNFAEEQAREGGYRMIELYTNERMTENVAFYKRLGYEQYDRREHSQRADSWLIYMRKPIT